MADIEALYSVFESFCQFGSTRDLSSIPSKTVSSQPQMDGAKFAKFSRDCDILDKQITPTEIDIVFNKVKSKTERKITFSQFKEALKHISKKKYPSKAEGEAFVHLVRLVAHNGNPQVATLVKTPGKASASNITERLTDPSLFTGTQKVQFEARLKSPATKQKRDYNSVLTPSQDHLDKISSKPKKRESESPRFVTSKGLSASASSISSTGKASVFDRLTDTSKYTGTHKERFDQNGNGLGLAGRDPTIKGSGSVTSYRGGQVTSLAQILRN